MINITLIYIENCLKTIVFDRTVFSKNVAFSFWFMNRPSTICFYSVRFGLRSVLKMVLTL